MGTTQTESKETTEYNEKNLRNLPTAEKLATIQSMMKQTIHLS